MSAVKLNSPRDLERFLRILAEESVMSAKDDMKKKELDEPKFQRAVTQNIKKDKAFLSEEDPEQPAAPKGEVPTSAPAEPAPAAEPDSEKPDAAAPTPKDVKPDELEPTMSGLEDAIKEIRGGKGVGDTAVESELSAYFDRLDAAERVSLIVMLRSIGGIMRQQLKGTAAPEPAQYNVYTTKKPGSEEKPAASSADVPSPEAKQGEPEDLTPPIKAGTPVTEAYRAKIKNLLKRS